MQCFIGLTFSEQYLHYKKIDTYRRRFDHKYTKSNILQMTLLPPFEISECDDDFLESLSDEIEGHLSGHSEVGEIHFNGVDFHSNKKRSVYLRPELPLELQYCQQSLWETVADSGGSFKQNKRPQISQTEDYITRTFLPIGRSNDSYQFEASVLAAKSEFEDPFYLKAKSICLFESTPGQWLLKKELYFLENQEFEFNEIDCLKGQVQALYV